MMTGEVTMTEEVTYALELDDVSVRFRDGEGWTYALRDVSLTVSAGEFRAVTGPSGSGKSTLLAVAGLLLTPTYGTVRIGGKDVSEASATARTDLRATYGGLEVGLGVFLLVCLSRVDFVRIGLLVATCAFTGMASGRLLGLLTDGGWQPLNWLVFVIEVAGAGFACVAFFTMREVRTAGGRQPDTPPGATPPGPPSSPAGV